MAVLLIERDADLHLWDDDDGGATLDELLSGAWESLTAATPSATCPVCHGELVPRWSAGAGVVGGRCRDCGSELG